MSIVTVYKELVLNGGLLNREQLTELTEAPLDELCSCANEIREHFCGNAFDICTIINGKSGRCSENCKFCSQSSHYCTESGEYPLLSSKEVVAEAQRNSEQGMLRFSIVTSGKKLTDIEVDSVCEIFKDIHENVDIQTCASHGLLSYEQFKKLYDAGLRRVHNNIETSRRNFPNICTTHTYDDKINAIKNAQRAGMTVCSGGIMGLGETMDDRIDMALDLRELGVRSIPLNVLNPIKGTPFENNKILTNDEVCRIVAIFRFAVPDAFIRMAGGRGLLGDKGRRVFQSGANAAISGDMLTTAGINMETDKQLLGELGYEIRLCEE